MSIVVIKCRHDAYFTYLYVIIFIVIRVMNTVWKSVTEAARENEIRKSDPGAVFNQDYRSS